MTTSLRRHERRILATQLIERGLRTTPVRRLTGLPEAEIRTLYRTIHGKSPPSGDVPSAAALFPTRRAQLQVSLFASIYRRLGGAKIFETVNANALVKSYDGFCELTKPLRGAARRPLDFTGAWVIARDLQSGHAMLSDCRTCRVPYLVAENSDLPPTCPYCALRRERKRLRNRENRRTEAKEAT